MPPMIWKVLFGTCNVSPGFSAACGRGGGPLGSGSLALQAWAGRAHSRGVAAHQRGIHRLPIVPRGGERLIVGYASLIELEVPHTRLGRRDEHKHSLGEELNYALNLPG